METHVHADFVSGHRELNERTGATIFINEHVQPGYRHYPVTDGDLFVLSDVYAFVPMYTPGHTLGCTTWLLVDRLHGNRPMKVCVSRYLLWGTLMISSDISRLSQVIPYLWVLWGDLTF